jgi:hypothetical protein
VTVSLNEVALTGTICSKFKYDAKDGGLHFSIKNEQGTFYVKAYGLANIRLCESMTEGQQVNVLGELHSFVDRKCRNHHIYLKAETLIPHDESPAFTQLITLVGVQAFYEARSKNGYSTPEDVAVPSESSLTKSLN